MRHAKKRNKYAFGPGLYAKRRNNGKIHNNHPHSFFNTFQEKQAPKFSEEYHSGLLTHTHTHKHTHREREREKLTSRA